MKKYCIGIIFFCSVLVIFSALPRTVDAIESMGLGGYPANPDPAIPGSQDWFVYTLNPGDTKVDSLVVRNNTLEDILVEFYPADQTPSAGGGLALKQKVEPMNEVGSWVTMNESEASLKSGEGKTVDFVVRVPKDVTPGDYIGGIIIQEVKPSVESTGGIALSTRMGIRMYITIPGEVKENIRILGLQHKPQPITEIQNWYDVFRSYDIITLSMQNEGNANHNVIASITVKNIFGGIMAEFSDLHFQVLKNSTYEWNSIWQTPVYGGPYYISASTDIEKKAGHETQVAGPMFVWIWPEWWILTSIALLILYGCIRALSGYLKRHEKKVIKPAPRKQRTRKAPEKVQKKTVKRALKKGVTRKKRSRF